MGWMQGQRAVGGARAMSALPTADVMVEADSSAACSPRLGLPPVPGHGTACVRPRLASP